MKVLHVLGNREYCVSCATGDLVPGMKKISLRTATTLPCYAYKESKIRFFTPGGVPS